MPKPIAVRVPGSKSLSNRALLLAALSGTAVRLEGLLKAEDTEHMQAALTAFGTQFSAENSGELIVQGPPQFIAPSESLFIGNAGTAARFLSALSLLTCGTFQLDGIPRMRERPQGDLFRALNQLGVEISAENPGYLPARFTGPLQGNSSAVTLNGKVSSQFVSALMLVAPLLPKGLRITVQDLSSEPYIAMTAQLLQVWGNQIEYETGDTEIFVPSGLKPPATFTVPLDMSAASYPLIWSCLRGESIQFTHFTPDAWQGDARLIDLLLEQGAQFSAENWIFTPPKAWQFPAVVDFSDMPDVSLSAMILAALQSGTTRFTGLHSLRVKECDRIQAMHQGLAKLGVQVVEEGDDLIITGRGLEYWQGGRDFSAEKIITYADHRVAMCFGVLQQAFGLNFTIDDPACVAKTWPEFWLELADWQGELRPVSAAIISRETAAEKREFLLVKKPRQDHAWQFPQGGVEPGESALSAAQRETQEECGKDLRVDWEPNPVGDYAYFFPPEFSRHQTGIRGARVEFFRGKFRSGSVQLDPNELVDFGWFDKKEICKIVTDDYFVAIQSWLD